MREIPCSVKGCQHISKGAVPIQALNKAKDHHFTHKDSCEIHVPAIIFTSYLLANGSTNGQYQEVSSIQEPKLAKIQLNTRGKGAQGQKLKHIKKSDPPTPLQPSRKTNQRQPPSKAVPSIPSKRIARKRPRALRGRAKLSNIALLNDHKYYNSLPSYLTARYPCPLMSSTKPQT